MEKTLDQDRVKEFLERVMIDSGAALAGLCTSIGTRLGLYRAMAGAGPLTSEALAARTGLDERYVREWLASQVAGQYVHHEPGTDTYVFPDEHAAVLADPASPAYAAGAFAMLQAASATARCSWRTRTPAPASTASTSTARPSRGRGERRRSRAWPTG
ncbi:hypothetical protein [Nonomuraea angiospora]